MTESIVDVAKNYLSEYVTSEDDVLYHYKIKEKDALMIVEFFDNGNNLIFNSGDYTKPLLKVVDMINHGFGNDLFFNILAATSRSIHLMAMLSRYALIIGNYDWWKCFESFRTLDMVKFNDGLVMYNPNYIQKIFKGVYHIGKYSIKDYEVVSLYKQNPQYFLVNPYENYPDDENMYMVGGLVYYEGMNEASNELRTKYIVKLCRDNSVTDIVPIFRKIAAIKYGLFKELYFSPLLFCRLPEGVKSEDKIDSYSEALRFALEPLAVESLSCKLSEEELDSHTIMLNDALNSVLLVMFKTQQRNIKYFFHVLSQIGDDFYKPVVDKFIKSLNIDELINVQGTSLEKYKNTLRNNILPVIKKYNEVAKSSNLHYEMMSFVLAVISFISNSEFNTEVRPKLNSIYAALGDLHKNFTRNGLLKSISVMK